LQIDEEREALMAHYGTLETQPVSDDVQDIGGTTVRDSDGKKLGQVDDVIFDHDTVEIRYVVVDSDGWLEAFCSQLIAFSRMRTTITVSPPKSQKNRSKILRNMTITWCYRATDGELRAGVQEILGRASGDAHEGLRPNHHAAGRARSR
jgi:sporulation protein YlmC with PRC-barrel domain